ncbi:hypothetical protein PAXINDRAFT_17608 [Paxillus involutus ATCC 200175]|uniref:Uncharacterized protein n=1 Tax=Paxillus involutus ATCC 200175 TaxID=664439 RepID=A0A0C9TEA8_PAXIN|nr:hypothetical protein PAXINDRAFT_17608 [Paxillus involutus ATCC 200175]
MIQRPSSIPAELWDTWSDRTKAAVVASQADERGTAQPNIDPILAGSGPRRTHDAYSDGPTAPYPYPPSGNGGTHDSRLSKEVKPLKVLYVDVLIHALAEVGEPLELEGSLYDEDAEDVTESRNKLSMVGREARTALKRIITSKFRFACNVPEGEKWPSVEEERLNPKTGESWLTPNFKTTVNDEYNRAIFVRVADLAWTDLQNIAQSECLRDRKIKWNKLSLLFAKETYRGFKPEWKADNDPHKMAEKVDHQCRNRWSQRRKDKAQRLMTAREAYISKHGVDPGELIHADHMSDEASGPEDNETEAAKLAWKQCMAAHKHIPNSEGALENISFLEVLRSPWRSKELEDVFVNLQDVWRESLSVKQKQCFHTIRVRDTERISPRIPEYTPFNFGINVEWLEVNKDKSELEDLLKEWGKWEDPEGFGSKKHLEDQGPADLGPSDEGERSQDEGTRMDLKRKKLLDIGQRTRPSLLQLTNLNHARTV